MHVIGRLLTLPAALLAFTVPAHADWQAAETIRHYAISGRSGPDLYASIGERGPKAGKGGRVIAHTNFRLTWQRDYQRRGEACMLASAVPKLTITYTLPRPKEPLPEPVRSHWRTFIAGVEAHERIHGAMIRDLVDEIEKATIGLAVENDPRCEKIRALMAIRLKAISDAHQQRNSDFDRAELSRGGKIHQLILALVNGQ
jgi:predicted secreted Zn-dependent protease